MAVCPECGERAPFGGGRTVQNAHLMFQLERELSRMITPDEDGTELQKFCSTGHVLADSLHNYGHKWSTVNPNWAAAGVWTRTAQETHMNS